MTDLLQAAAEAVELGRAATPGPWNWREARGSRRIDLAAPHGGGSVVMDFARNGMQGAEPRFAVCMDGLPRGRRGGILRSASELVKADPDGLLRHPDALLIAAAQGHVDLIRDLAAEVERLRADAASKSEYAIDRISMADAIRVMNDLMLMVEGPFCVDWRNANGLRIKDTSEWALFYVKTVKMVRSLEEVEGKEAVQELFAKLRDAARTGDSHER